MTAIAESMTTYIIALRDDQGRTLIEDHGDHQAGDLSAAKRRYRGHVAMYNGGGYSDDVAEIALIRAEGRKRSTVASTRSPKAVRS